MGTLSRRLVAAGYRWEYQSFGFIRVFESNGRICCHGTFTQVRDWAEKHCPETQTPEAINATA